MAKNILILTDFSGGTWDVKDGVLVGTSPKSERRHGILLSDRTFSDFILTAKFRVISGNSGLYFRAERVPQGVGVHGFQVEVDTSQKTGGLYETGGRGWVEKPTAEAIQQRRYQPEHHRKQTFQEEYREFLQRHHVEFDEQYMWD